MNIKFIKDLKEYLVDKNVSKEEVKEIIDDYTELYNDFSDRGFNDEEISKKLGTVRIIYRDIKSTVNRDRTTWKSKVVAVTPFIATAIYILVGYFSGIWHPTWLVFLLIPLSSVILYGENLANRLLTSSPFIATIIFLIIGFYLNVWHPTWLIFLIIPIFGIIAGNKDSIASTISSSLIFIGLAVAVLLPYFNILSWTYSWLFILAFLIPAPLTYTKHKNKTKFLKNVITSITLTIAIVIYIVIVATTGKVRLGLLPFILPFLAGIWSGNIIFNINLGKGKQVVIFSIISILSIAAFVTLGVIYNNWAYIWQVLLLIPIAAVITLPDTRREKVVPVITFISVIIFYSIGYFYDAWAVSWLAFLLIPISSILQGEKVVKINVEDNSKKGKR